VKRRKQISAALHYASFGFACAQLRNYHRRALARSEPRSLAKREHERRWLLPRDRGDRKRDRRSPKETPDPYAHRFLGDFSL
jgi:hypothetical protein